MISQQREFVKWSASERAIANKRPSSFSFGCHRITNQREYELASSWRTALHDTRVQAFCPGSISSSKNSHFAQSKFPFPLNKNPISEFEKMQTGCTSTASSARHSPNRETFPYLRERPRVARASRRRRLETAGSEVLLAAFQLPVSNRHFPISGIYGSLRKWWKSPFVMIRSCASSACASKSSAGRSRS